MRGLYTEKIIDKDNEEEIKNIVEAIKEVDLQSISIERYH